MSLKDIFTPEIIKYFKEHKEEITSELLQELRSYGNEGKQLCLDILDTVMDEEEYHLDAFGKRITFDGNRALKSPMTKMNLSPIHIEEIKRCSQDLEYFKDNYVKIKTRSGVNFPDLREYQNEFIKILTNDENESVVAMMPRQCITAGTMIDVGSKVSVYSLFSKYKENKINHEKIISYVEPNIDVLTDIGYVHVDRINKMVPMLKVIVKTKDFTLKCAENHVIIDQDNNEVFAKDSLRKIVKTVKGLQEVIEVQECGYNEDMYDLVLREHHLYFTNGILSHNSGKTSTTAIFLAWKYNFGFNFNIGILANKGGTAREFLSSTKDILINLPMWMQVGTQIWNVSAIKNENNVRILTDVPSENSFRGFTCIHGDHFVEVYDKILGSVSKIKIRDLCNKDTCKYLINTPNGFKEFKGVIKSNETEGLEISFGSDVLKCTKTHRIKNNNEWILAKDIKTGMMINSHECTNIKEIQGDFYDPLDVEGHEYKTVACDFLTHHNCAILVVDECIGYDSEIETNKGKFKIGDLYKLNDDSINMVKTSDGFRKFHGVKKHTKDKGLRIFVKNTSIECTEDHKFFRGEFVYAKDLKVNDTVWVNGKEERVQRIEKIDVPQDYYDLIDVEPHHHFTANGIEVSNCAWIRTTLIEPTLDSLLPSQGALAYKKNIFLSTPHGLNHFSNWVNSAKKRKIYKERDADEDVMMPDGSRLKLSEVYEKINNGELKIDPSGDYIDGIEKMESKD